MSKEGGWDMNKWRRRVIVRGSREPGKVMSRNISMAKAGNIGVAIGSGEL